MGTQQKKWFFLPEDIEEGILSEELVSNGGLVFGSRT